MSDTNIVSPLRRRMIEDMTARKLTSGTQRSHLQSCRRFAAWLKRSLDTATPDDVRQFQLHLIESGQGHLQPQSDMTGVLLIFRVTLRRHDLAAEVWHIKEPQEAAAGAEPRGGQACPHDGDEPEGASDADTRLWLRAAVPVKWRGCEAGRYRQ